MISNLNRSVFMGHLGKDATQSSLNEIPVRFPIAVSTRWTDNNGNHKERTDWHSIVVFGNLRRYAAKLKKGDRVYVEAEARNNNYERKIGNETITIYGTEFYATAIEWVASRSQDDSNDDSVSESAAAYTT